MINFLCISQFEKNKKTKKPILYQVFFESLHGVTKVPLKHFHWLLNTAAS